MTIRQKMLLLIVISAAGQLATFAFLYSDVQSLAAFYAQVHAEGGNEAFREAIGDISSHGLLMILIFFPLVTGVILFLTFSIMRKMSRIVETMREAVAQSDLTRRMTVEGNDELAELARSYNLLMEEFSNIIGAIDDGMESLQQAIVLSGGVARELDDAVRKEGEKIHLVASAMEEMAATVKEVARNAATTAQATNSADRDAGESLTLVQKNRASIDELAREIEQASVTLDRLNTESEGIAAMLDSIRSIAEQTNLLALNAAIEAARAGEQGRGFAVVADEVRTLAQRTQNSTNEIEDVVNRLLMRIREAVQSMEAGKQRADESVMQARMVNEALDRIRNAVSQVNEMNLQVASATEEQGAVAEEINRNVNDMAELGESTRNCVDKARDARREVEEVAVRLGEVTGRFHSAKG